MSLIHLIFKTHLDIGFTDQAARVRQIYHDQFIPQALTTAEHFHAENPEEPLFVWTTGAWLIHDHLATQPAAKARRLERAIERGLIAWHALPFTTHSEVMSADLFRAGLSYAAELDARFGRQTRAAKMTDVPGHTLGIVPLLAEAGVRFLHLGVNTASPVPDVPPLFRWRATDGSEVVVMYQASYGSTDFPIGPGIGLGFAHTQDNIGPQTVPQVIEARRALSHQHPGARLVASTLDAFGGEVWARRESLPVVTDEIGDSWIHGVGSDPQKLARFRALQRHHESFETITPARRDFGRALCMVAEHTWGVDIKTYLRDETAWNRAEFEVARARDPRFAFVEASWAEQRAYLDRALAHLPPEDLPPQETPLEVWAAERPGPTRPAAAAPATRMADAGWQAEVDPTTGDLLSLSAPDGRVLAATTGSLLGFRHESYDHAALQAHLDSYLQHRLDWAVLDHDKPGLAGASTACHHHFAPLGAGIARGHVSLGTLPALAHDLLGAPASCAIALRGLDGDRVEVSLSLAGKPANRMPEAGFLHLGSETAEPRLRKMGLWLDPGRIVPRGGGQLQAAEALRFVSGALRVQIDLLDAALVGPLHSPFMPYQPAPPDFTSGMRVNLYNNKWGTNFPMWVEGDMRFRFVLTFR